MHCMNMCLFNRKLCIILDCLYPTVPGNRLIRFMQGRPALCRTPHVSSLPYSVSFVLLGATYNLYIFNILLLYFLISKCFKTVNFNIFVVEVPH